MPYARPSWRLWPQHRLISRALCFIFIHHWLMSQTLKKPLACTVCGKKTRYYEAYEKLQKDP